MTDRHSKQCSLCGAEKKTQDHQGYRLCSDCAVLFDGVKNHPHLIERLWKELHGRPLAAASPAPPKGDTELPDVLDGKRYRTIDRERNPWYLSISEVEGRPVEVFASTAFDRDHELQSRISNLTTITRLISLNLRHIFIGEQLTLKKILKQLKRSSRQKNDLPDMLYQVLALYDQEGEEAQK